MSSSIFLITASAVSLRQDKSILFSRIGIKSLLFTSFIAINNLYVAPLEKGVGIYRVLFNANALTHTFNIFVFLVSAIILILTSFYPRKIYIKNFYRSLYRLLSSKLSYNKELISNKIAAAFKSLFITITSQLKKMTINNVILLLGFSVCVKSFFSAISLIFNTTYQNIYYIFLGPLFVIIALSLIKSKDRLGYVINLLLRLLIILLFWMAVGYSTGLLFEIETYPLLVNFLLYYQADGALHMDLGVPHWIKDVLSKAFQSLDNNLDFNHFHPGGPGSILIYYDPRTDEDVYSITQMLNPWMRLEEIEYTTNYNDYRWNYHKVTHWYLSHKYHQWASIASFIDKYNDSLPYKSNWHISKQNELASTMGFGISLIWDLCHDNPLFSETIQYKSMVRFNHMFIWEDYVLNNARFYCENKEIINSSNILLKIFTKQQSA